MKHKPTNGRGLLLPALAQTRDRDGRLKAVLKVFKILDVVTIPFRDSESREKDAERQQLL